MLGDVFIEDFAGIYKLYKNAQNEYIWIEIRKEIKKIDRPYHVKGVCVFLFFFFVGPRELSLTPSDRKINWVG